MVARRVKIRVGDTLGLRLLSSPVLEKYAKKGTFIKKQKTTTTKKQ